MTELRGEGTRGCWIWIRCALFCSVALLVEGFAPARSPRVRLQSTLKSSSTGETSATANATATQSSDDANPFFAESSPPQGGRSQRGRRRASKQPQVDLYAVLGGDASMSKTELKRLYISLAKETHPDSATYNEQSDDRFNTISQAWTVLSDPKTRRAYDRELAAQRLSEDVVSKASDIAKEYGPAAKSFYEELALPFVKRATASTVAGWSAASENKDEEDDIGKTFSRVLEAGLNASRQVDGADLKQKSADLREQALAVEEESKELFERLAMMKLERMHVTFNSEGVNFTSAEANQYLDGCGNATDEEVGLMERMMFSNSKVTVKKQIELFTQAELDYNFQLERKQRVDKEFDLRQRELKQAERDAQIAAEAEERAKQMLADAKQRVVQTRKTLSTASRSLREEVSHNVRTANADLKRAANGLQHKREAVRKAMKRRASTVENTVFKTSDGKVRLNPDLNKSAMNESERIETIKQLTQDEARAELEYVKLTERAKRLLSRSERLQIRSDELIGEQASNESDAMKP